MEISDGLVYLAQTWTIFENELFKTCQFRKVRGFCQVLGVTKIEEFQPRQNLQQIVFDKRIIEENKKGNSGKWQLILL